MAVSLTCVPVKHVGNCHKTGMNVCLNIKIKMHLCGFASGHYKFTTVSYRVATTVHIELLPFRSSPRSRCTTSCEFSPCSDEAVVLWP